MVDQESAPSPQSPAHRLSEPSPHSPQFRRLVRLLLAGGIPLLVAVAVLTTVFSDRTSESEVLLNEKLHTIQLDVLNGTGQSKLAQRMTDFLRSRGFDVVEMGNYAGDVEATLVIDRTGNREAAIRVAKAIGVPETQVVQKIDKNLYLDVSVYIGKDFRTLQPFQ